MVGETSSSNGKRKPAPKRNGRMRNDESGLSPDAMQCSFDFNADARPALSYPRGPYEKNGELNSMPNPQLTIENINSILIDRLDKNVSLQTEILSRLEKMIAVQEEKIDQQEKLGANLVKMMEDRRVDTEHKFDEQNKRIVDVEKSIVSTLNTHLTNLREDQHNRHQEFTNQQTNQLREHTESISKVNEKIDGRITKIERVIYAILGIGSVSFMFAEYVLPLLVHTK